ncbi:MAG: hypothetical protein RIR10_719, partial [Planctomycetota bacterium]
MMWRRAPRAAAVRPMFPVLFGISGFKRTMCRRGRSGHQHVLWDRDFRIACIWLASALQKRRGQHSAIEFVLRERALKARPRSAVFLRLTNAQEAPHDADDDPESVGEENGNHDEYLEAFGAIRSVDEAVSNVVGEAVGEGLPPIRIQLPSVLYRPTGNAPCGIRTCDLRFRKALLYPAELRGHR